MGPRHRPVHGRGAPRHAVLLAVVSRHVQGPDAVDRRPQDIRRHRLRQPTRRHRANGQQHDAVDQCRCRDGHPRRKPRRDSGRPDSLLRDDRQPRLPDDVHQAERSGLLRAVFLVGSLPWPELVSGGVGSAGGACPGVYGRWLPFPPPDVPVRAARQRPGVGAGRDRPESRDADDRLDALVPQSDDEGADGQAQRRRRLRG